MWKHFFDGFNLIHGILLAIAAVASFRFWARTRFRFPTYVHVLAVIGSIAILTVFWAEPEELREKISVVRMLVGALIGPALVYFFFIVYGGPRAAFYSRFSDSAPCPFCQSPVRVLPEDPRNPKASPQFAEPACPECGRELA